MLDETKTPYDSVKKLLGRLVKEYRQNTTAGLTSFPSKPSGWIQGFIDMFSGTVFAEQRNNFNAIETSLEEIKDMINENRYVSARLDMEAMNYGKSTSGTVKVIKWLVIITLALVILVGARLCWTAKPKSGPMPTSNSGIENRLTQMNHVAETNKDEISAGIDDNKEGLKRLEDQQAAILTSNSNIQSQLNGIAADYQSFHSTIRNMFPEQTATIKGFVESWVDKIMTRFSKIDSDVSSTEAKVESRARDIQTNFDVSQDHYDKKAATDRKHLADQQASSTKVTVKAELEPIVKGSDERERRHIAWEDKAQESMEILLDSNQRISQQMVQLLEAYKKDQQKEQHPPRQTNNSKFAIAETASDTVTHPGPSEMSEASLGLKSPVSSASKSVTEKIQSTALPASDISNPDVKAEVALSDESTQSVGATEKSFTNDSSEEGKSWTASATEPSGTKAVGSVQEKIVTPAITIVPSMPTKPAASRSGLAASKYGGPAGSRPSGPGQPKSRASHDNVSKETQDVRKPSFKSQDIRNDPSYQLQNVHKSSPQPQDVPNPPKAAPNVLPVLGEDSAPPVWTSGDMKVDKYCKLCEQPHNGSARCVRDHRCMRCGCCNHKESNCWIWKNAGCKCSRCGETTHAFNTCPQSLNWPKYNSDMTCEARLRRNEEEL